MDKFKKIVKIIRIVVEFLRYVLDYLPNQLKSRKNG